jgi:hypothetical protein
MAASTKALVVAACACVAMAVKIFMEISVSFVLMCNMYKWLDGVAGSMALWAWAYTCPKMQEYLVDDCKCLFGCLLDLLCEQEVSSADDDMQYDSPLALNLSSDSEVKVVWFASCTHASLFLFMEP